MTFDEDVAFARRLLLGVLSDSRGVVYVSGCITSGLLELALMKELDCSTREELRTRYPSEHRQRVIEENERRIHRFARQVQASFPKLVVINPGSLFKAGWSQEDYMAFWRQIIAELALKMAVTPEWPYSKGARIEVDLAVRMLIPLHRVDGTELAVADLMKADLLAHQLMAEQGWSTEFIKEYLPPIDFAGALREGGRFDEADLVQRLSKLITDHNEQARRRRA